MTRLDDRLRGLDEVAVPDVWRLARDRGPQRPHDPPPSPARRIGTIVLALLIAFAAFAFAASRLGEHRDQIIGGQPAITRYRFGGPPQPLVAGEGAAWVHVGAGDVGESDAAGLWRIDAQTGERRRLNTPGGDWPAVGGGSAWVLCDSQACGGGAVVQLDARSGEIVRTVDLPGRGVQIDGTADGVWVTTDAGLAFVSADGELSRTFRGNNYDLLGTDGSSLWVSNDGGLLKVDPDTGDQLLHVSSFPDVCTMEVADGTVWVASCDGGMHAGGSQDELMGLDAASGEVLFREPLQADGQMRFLDGVLWLAERPQEGGPLRIVGFDPRTGAPTGASVVAPRDETLFRTMGFSSPAVFLAAAEGSLWITDFGAGEVIRLTPPAPTATATSDAARPSRQAPASHEPSPALGSEAPAAFVPGTRRVGGKVKLNVTFPDGSTAQLAYPPSLDLAGLGVRPYWTGCGADFGFFHYDPYGSLYEGEPIQTWIGTDGQTVGLWPGVKGMGPSDHLIWHFGPWTVEKYEYRVGGSTSEELAACAEGLRATVTDAGWVVIDGPPDVRLSGGFGPPGGAELEFGDLAPRRFVLMWPGPCDEVGGGTVIDGVSVDLSKDFASWCDPGGQMRIHVYFEPGSTFFRDVFDGLAVQEVTLATRGG